MGREKKAHDAVIEKDACSMHKNSTKNFLGVAESGAD